MISISAYAHPPSLAQKNNYLVSALELLGLVSVSKKGREGGETSHLWFKLVLKYLGVFKKK